jgi:hypothetical protein
MASLEEEVKAELEQERLAREKEATSPVNPVVDPAPVAQPPVQAATPTPAPVATPNDIYTEVNAEIEQERLASQQTPVAPAKPEEPKEPLYVTKFREYGPDKDDEDVKTSLELLTPEQRHDLLKSQPWAYTKFTPEQQEEDFEESRKVKPMSGEDVANIAGYLYGTGVEVVKSSAKVLGDLANVGILAPVQQAIKNKSFLEVKGENEIVQAAQEKLDDDARNLSGAIPSSIIRTTRMIQKMLGGKDLNSIANPIQRAIATLAPTDLQGVIGQPIPDPNAGQENRWRLVPSNTGIIPLDLVTIIAQAASDKDAGGIAFLDRINERLGIADKDQSRNRDHIRKLYDAQVGAEDWKASNGQKKLSPWSQVAFSDVGQQAILFRERSLLPSVEFIAEHDGISLEQAQDKRNKIAENNAERATTELTREWNREQDPSMEFLGSLFLGDAAFGEAGLALGAGKLASPLLQKASTLGMTDREVSRYYDALQKLEKAKLIARQKDLSKPSWWGKSAEYVEKKQEEISAAGQSLFENLPAPVKAAAPLAGKALAKVGLGGVGGGVGALLDPENPSVGMLQGLTLTTGLGVAPSVIRSVDRARRMIGAGEGKLFTEVAKSPESSLPARLIFNKATGPVIDYIAENSTALFKSGVNLGALSAVTSTLNSDDPEEFNQAVADGFGMGMGFHLAHGAAGRIHGKDPAQDLNNRRKRDVEIFEAVKTASPATQGMLEQVSNFQTAIDRVDALVGRSEANLAEAMGKEDPKQTKLAADALKNARALQKEVLRANVQTRNEYGRSFLSTYADMNRLANGSRRAGQPNISLEILSPEQITDLYVSENSRQGMTPDEIAAVRAQGDSYANERGYFDKAKNRAVINAKSVLDRTTLFGESPSDALRHEGSHALDQIPEFQKLNEKTDKLLFTNEEKDLQGNVLNRTEGIYDEKALVDMYFNKYIGEKNQAEKIKFSEQLKLYNPETKQFNIPEIVKYMKAEVRAELSAGSLRSGLGKLMGAEATIANWVGMRQKQNLLARAIQSVTGLGGKPFSSSLLGIEYTPEVIAANKEAIKALADFNGRFDFTPEGTTGREMSEKEIRTSPVLRKRYGLSGGEFQTELKGVVRDANGKIVGTPVRVANPTAAEGNWTFDEAGNRKQTRGYGQVPDEFQGVDIPAGGSLEVYRDFVYEPDGKTPVATRPNDLADLETERGNLIRQALTDAIYDDSTTRLAPFSADGLSWEGIMSKSQVQAIKSIPESILPLSIKEKILAFNDTMARGDGSTFDLDYAPRIGTSKKYKGRKSDIYHVIPIGFGFSKAGNFYLRSLSLNAAFRKLKARAKLMDGWLTPWDNNPNLFMKELQEIYLNNTYEKRDGWLGLDPENPTEKTPLAEVKFGRFLDFMNMVRSDTPPNPQRATTPADPSARKRKSKAGAEEDNEGIDNLWRSFRLDAIADLADTTEQTGRYRIDRERVYKALMPAEGAETAPAQEERRPTPFDGITAAYKPATPNAGISFMPRKPTEEYPTSERGFYSGLQKTIDEKMPAKASPQQILSIVNNPQNAKAEEVKWSNLAGFVEGKTSVTKQEVLDYLRNEGSVKFEEKMFGAKPDEVLSTEDETRLAFLEKENAKAPLGAMDDAQGEGTYLEMMRLQNIRDKSTTEQLYAKQEQLERGARHEQRTNPKKADTLWKESQHMTARAEALELQGAGMSEQPKFGQYVLAGGENYREVNLIDPSIEDWRDFPRAHVYGDSYDPVNMKRVAHMRLDERKDSTGKDGLFIEEIQSDRHQAGREKGYADNEKDKELYDIAKQYYQLRNPDITQKQSSQILADLNARLKKIGAKASDLDPILRENGDFTKPRKEGIPDAPFRKDWPVQMFKRALRDAIEGDKEWIGWTKGETQVGRYDLSKQVRDISYRQNDGELQARGINGGRAVSKSGVTPDKLESFVGKEVAQKLLEEPTGQHFSKADGMGMGWHTLSGQDLKVGGEGMKGFYDQILPKKIGKYVEKWGAKVEKGETNSSQEPLRWKVYDEDGEYGGWFTNENDAKKEADRLYGTLEKIGGEPTPIWKVKITPEMRSSIKEGGQIAFMPKSESREEERTERLPASGAELTASLVASGTSLESFGKDTLIQLAESYGIELPKGAKRGEIIDAITERPIQAPVASQPQETDISPQGDSSEKAQEYIESLSGKKSYKDNYYGKWIAIPQKITDSRFFDSYELNGTDRSAQSDSFYGVLTFNVPSDKYDALEKHLGDKVDELNLERDEDTGNGTIEFRYRVSDHGVPQSSKSRTNLDIRVDPKTYGAFEKRTKRFGGQTIIDTPDAVYPTWEDAAKNIVTEARKMTSDISFMPSSKLDEAHADLEKRYKAGDKAAIEEAKRLVGARAREAGYDSERDLYHGTTHKFTIFSTERSNVENDMGKGFYFSSNPKDVEGNYAGEGPDLTSRIERRQEQIGFDLEEIKTTGELRKFLQSRGVDPSFVTDSIGYASDGEKEAAAKAIARKELSGGSPKTLKTYVRLENPAILGGKDETKLEYGYDEDTGEEEGSALDFINAVRNVASEFDDTDADIAVADLTSEDLDGMGLANAVEKLKNSEGIIYASDENGDQASGEIIRQILEQLGYDGIIDNNVNKKFGSEKRVGKPMKGMDEDTFHVIAFDPNQIKSADPFTYDDKGKLIPPSQRFDLSKQDIRFMPASKGEYEKVKEKVPSLLPINEQPENLPVVGRLTTGQQQAIDELDKYYAEKTPQRVQELKKDAEESLSSRLTNLGIPVSDSKKIASKAFGDLRKSVKGAMQVISGMGLSDLSRMAGSGRPSVETRQKISPAWLTSAFESFETDDSLALMKAQQVATQLNKADQAKVVAGEDVESAKASKVRQSTIEQGMNFVIGERTADQKAFGSSLREDMDAPPRVYASVVEGQKYGSQGNYNLFFDWDQATPMVITSHHHYGVGNGLTDIHASANVGDKNARSFGDTTTEKYDTLPSGKKILNTKLLVGNEGASDIRAHQLMVSIPKSALDDVKRAFKASGTKAAEAEIDKIVSSQLVGQAGRGKAAAYTTDEGIPPYAAAQKNRTEAYVLNPDLQNVKRITIVSNKPKEIELITKNLQRAFENNGTKLPKIDVVTKDSGASNNTGRKAITDRFFKLTGELAFMPETKIQEPTKIDWSVFTQKAEKPLSTLRAYANPQQQDEIN